MKFSVTELKQFKVVEKTEEYDPQRLIWDPPEFAIFLGRIGVQAEAKLISEDVMVEGEITSKIKLKCVRCLNEFEKSHDAKFQQIYSIEGEIIDISTEIRESLLIDLPMHPVCQPSCPGVVPNRTSQDNPSVFYSDELKSDPRWDKLKKIN
jgi:uncharacterized protein